MRILLDENLDWRLRRDLPGHEVDYVPFAGWGGMKNGRLLAVAQERFDVLVTMDCGIPSQQNLARFRIAVIALRARSNRLADTRPLMPHVLGCIALVTPGSCIVIADSGVVPPGNGRFGP